MQQLLLHFAFEEHWLGPLEHLALLVDALEESLLAKAMNECVIEISILTRKSEKSYQTWRIMTIIYIYLHVSVQFCHHLSIQDFSWVLSAFWPLLDRCLNGFLWDVGQGPPSGLGFRHRRRGAGLGRIGRWRRPRLLGLLAVLTEELCHLSILKIPRCFRIFFKSMCNDVQMFQRVSYCFILISIWRSSDSDESNGVCNPTATAHWCTMSSFNSLDPVGPCLPITSVLRLLGLCGLSLSLSLGFRFFGVFRDILHRPLGPWGQECLLQVLPSSTAIGWQPRTPVLLPWGFVRFGRRRLRHWFCDRFFGRLFGCHFFWCGLWCSWCLWCTWRSCCLRSGLSVHRSRYEGRVVLRTWEVGIGIGVPHALLTFSRSPEGWTPASGPGSGGPSAPDGLWPTWRFQFLLWLASRSESYHDMLLLHLMSLTQRTQKMYENVSRQCRLESRSWWSYGTSRTTHVTYDMLFSNWTEMAGLVASSRRTACNFSFKKIKRNYFYNFH